ncbi:hypothetical protein L207DRAFT_73683 [Hyaloscypha variabilis F]|uniref:Uncharacterized protein n=1 Tax=Hyaloscypha variabilis (strain UAMH 11265 / GT02V1 / F) TaxID=1149755 RepID=A0A2J6RFN1_HYAVF|nr:hypothetical protein L207DRAFT_73683 [Hyaloscypha variabilis F]
MMHLVEARPDFAQLDDASWDDITNRGSVSRAAITMTEYGGDGDTFTPDGFLQQDYEAAWSVLQAVSMDSIYLTKTEYNLFTLLRQGNEFSVYEPEYWELFNQTKRILRQSVEFYLLERLCAQMASGDMIPPFDQSSSTPNTLVLVDLKDDMESFLRRFEKICVGRAKLTGFAQLACFYALLVFGIAKSILIDAYSIRADYEDPNPWEEQDAVRITSAYKALVSVFCWSSKSDIVLDPEIDQDDELGAALLETRAMVQSAKWEGRGVRGMKEFLLGLGSCFFADGAYNGFFMQKFGKERIPRTFAKGAVVVNGNSEARSNYTRPKESGSPRPGRHFSDETKQAPTVHVFSVAQERESFRRFEGSKQRDSVSFLPSPSKALFQDTPRESTNGAHRPSISANQSTFTFVSHDENEGHSAGRGQSRRKGALDAETLRKAREVRKLGACWNCWVMKIPCSEGSICDRCRKKSNSPVYRLCNRNPFTAYAELLFPDYLISDFSTQALQRYTAENTGGFTGQILNVVVTWGEGTLKLRASPFLTLPNGIMQTKYHSQDGHPLGVESLPVGLTEANMVLLEQTCLEELENKLANQDFVSGVCCWRTADVSRTILETVFRYYDTMPAKHPLIHTILQLRLAIRAISNPPIFTDSSAKMILYHTQTKYPSVEFYSSRLLNRQLKHITFKLCRQLAFKALSKLEKAVRSRDKGFWPIYFVSMILLCSTIEHDQILLNAHIQTARAAQPDMMVGMEDEPQKACQELEDGPCAQLTHLFHALYRTGKRDSGGLNPFRDEFELNAEKHFDAPAMAMIREIKKNVFEKAELLKERDKPLVLDMRPEDFAKRNSGRLVARFLLSFLPLNEVRAL